MVAGAGVLDLPRLPGGLAKSRITDTFSPACVVLRDLGKLLSQFDFNSSF